MGFAMKTIIEDQMLNCTLFHKDKCPNQLEMERFYLIPQLLTPEQLQSYENICCECEHSTGDRSWNR